MVYPFERRMMRKKVGVTHMKLQESGENYLETILILEKRNGIARSVDVAAELGFSKPSVSRAVHILKEGGYVTIGNIGQLLLTEKGRQVAQNIYDRHCFIKECLMFLGVSPETAEADACRLEHVLSEESLACMKAHYESHMPKSEL